ncbi:MAG: T9SS type A sorting domain-containing protein, partial [Bacteroidota bacterium]
AEDIIVGTNNDPANPVFETLSFVIKNTGTVTVTDPTVKYYVNGSFVTEETISASIEGGAIYTHEFSQVSGFTAGAGNRVIAVVNAPDDENLSDDATRTFITPDLMVNTEELSPSIFNIYPNPSNGTFNVELSDDLLGGTMRIFCSQGKLIRMEKVNALNFPLSLNSVGLHWMVIQKNDGTSLVKKIVTSGR